MYAQGSKTWPPSGHLRLKNPVWRVKKSFSVDSLATESCRIVDRLVTKLFFQSGQHRCGPNVIAQGAWQSLSVQDARELAVRAPSMVFASKFTNIYHVPAARWRTRACSCRHVVGLYSCKGPQHDYTGLKALRSAIIL